MRVPYRQPAPRRVTPTLTPRRSADGWLSRIVNRSLEAMDAPRTANLVGAVFFVVASIVVIGGFVMIAVGADLH